jgi:hypothetical protein
MITSKVSATVVVYYRDIPLILKNLIEKDNHIFMIKDGIKKINGQCCPRVTININENKDQKKKFNNLIYMLEGMVSNNQIVDFSVVYNDIA